MAVAGRNLGASIYQRSDDYFEFPCTPCTKEGKNVAAIKHCEDCDENFCSSCLKDHNKFSAMRGHQVLDTMQSPSGAIPQLPKQRCAKHGGKVIDVFCPSHDTVCCSTCIAVEHSTCQGITFIPDVAKNIRTSNELQQFESKMASLKSRCILLSQSKDSDTQTLKQDKIKLLEEIRNFRKKINDHFDKMEKRLVDEADAQFKQKMETVDDERKEIQDILENLRKADQRLQDAKQENKYELFAVLKSERTSIDKFFPIIEKIECAGTTNSMKLTVEKRVENMMSEGYGIGEIDECYKNIVASFHGEYDVDTENEVSICLIAGICLCEGHIFLTDYNNNLLKKLDNNYKLTSYLTMPNSPAGVCNVGDVQLAVTLPKQKKVQFVSYTEPMQLLASFHVGDFCRGVEYRTGLLFVCCGGYKEGDEGPGHVEIYNISGTLMRSFYGMTGLPRSLSVSPDGNYIYVTFLGEDSLAVYGTSADTVYQFQYHKVKGGSGICRLSSKLLCITGRVSHNIAVINTNDGVFKQLILTREDNIEKPVAICFDEKNSRLLVSTFDSGKLKVFQLNI